MLNEISRRITAGEIRLTRDGLIDEINIYGNRWYNAMSWFWRDTLSTRWAQNYNDPDHDIYQWTNFFTGPLARYNDINYDMAQAYGLPQTCCHILINNFIVQNSADEQYYLSISNATATRMGFNGLPGFVLATALPVLP